LEADMSSFRAAKTIGKLTGWRISNLSLQKLLYLAHMGHLAETGRGIVSRQFEAWDYGPVEPDVYHQFKAYGSKPIVDVLPGFAYEPGDTEYAAIADLLKALGSDFSPGRLVAITHWEDGAWARHYVPGVKGIVIPDADILDEYERRLAASKRTTGAGPAAENAASAPAG
jgi:uncharacterized phage-associated protein